MTSRRALLIGSPTGLLRGVDNDILRMADALAGYDFTIARCTGDAATRAGIHAAYERLIAASQPEDAALVYFAGHGGLAVNPDYRPGSQRPRFYQFIVPTDIEASRDGDFRGILAQELAALLSRLTARTRNTTVILDCCHAARMSRGCVTRSLARVWRVGLSEHVRALERRGATRREHVEGNPHAVRVLAASASQPAYERDDAAGERVGVLTEALARALAEARGREVTWAALAGRLREHVLETMPAQRVAIAGPITRLLFTLEERARVDELTLAREGPDGALFLEGGALLGVAVGDRYALLNGSSGAGRPRATARVVEVTAARARVVIEGEGARDMSSSRDGLRARPVARAPRRHAVILEPTGAEGQARAARLRRAIDASPLLRARDVGAVSRDMGMPIARARLEGDAIALLDPTGAPLSAPERLRPQRLAGVVANLESLARARELRARRSGEGAQALTGRYAVEWGRVRDGVTIPLPQAGATLFAGDRVYLRVFNEDLPRLYVSVYDVGVSGRISLLTSSEPAGVELALREDYTLGADESGVVEGLEAWWPRELPTSGGPRLESFVVFLSDRPLDLRALEAPGIRRLDRAAAVTRASPARATSLAAGAELVRYAIERVDFQLHPTPARPRDDGPYWLDERPDPSALALPVARPRRPPAAARVHLLEASLDPARVSSPAGARHYLDVAVVTGGAGPGALRLHTLELPPGDVARAGVDLLHGPAHTAIELALWLSVARDQPPPLERARVELRRRAEWRDALQTLAALTSAPAEPDARLRAADAAACLNRQLFAWLAERRATVEGCYRVSLAGARGFEIGRHPRRGRLRAGPLRFVYRVLRAIPPR